MALLSFFMPQTGTDIRWQIVQSGFPLAEKGETA